MKIVDRLRDECIGNVFTIDELDCIMEEVKYFPSEYDDEDEEGILKYSNGRSEIWFKFSMKDECEYLISDVTYKVKKNGKTQVHAFKNWTIVNKKDTKRERLRRNHLLKSQFFFVGSQVSI